MFQNALSSLCAVLAFAACHTPNPSPPTHFGFEAQVYPTGAMIGPRAELELSERDALHARAAVHFVDRGDAGDQDDETGSGWGVGGGWRHWIDSYGEGWHFGARADIWRLDIEWSNVGPPRRSGNTDVTVLVPAIEGGYSWTYKNGGRLDLTVGLGREFNVDTDGAEVGEGAVLMFGASFSAGTRGILRLHERRRWRPLDPPTPERDVVSMVGVD